MNMRMSARVPYGSTMESIPSQLEQQIQKPFSRMPYNQVHNSIR